MAEMGLIFNMQRYSVHDGKGIRTIVFFKGCPLHCPWCSNPESIGPVKPSVWMKNGRKETVGSWMTVDEIVKEVQKDELFFRTSGGGITLSGGEVLLQHTFAAKLLKELKACGYHTAIETTGCCQVSCLKTLLPYLDAVLFDLKILDPVVAKKIVGADQSLVLENLQAAVRSGVEFIPRLPLIPGYTTLEENLLAVIKCLKEHELKSIHLLPFHQYGSNKYTYLGKKYMLAGLDKLTENEIQSIQAIFESNGISANVEGLA